MRADAVEAMLVRVNLWDVRKKPLAGFSGGMCQRFGIAQALIGNPRLLIVDEPTAGLDPGERNRFHNLLAEIGENVIVILSTHIVADVLELCPNMAIIHKGQLLYTGDPQSAVRELEGMVWRKLVDKATLRDHEEHYRVTSSKLIAGRPLIRILRDSPSGDGFEATPPDLEDVFFSRVGNAH